MPSPVSTEEQRRVSGEVATNIDSIADMAKENNKAIEQTAVSARKLEQLASDLQDIVAASAPDPPLHLSNFFAQGA